MVCLKMLPIVLERNEDRLNVGMITETCGIFRFSIDMKACGGSVMYGERGRDSLVTKR